MSWKRITTTSGMDEWGSTMTSITTKRMTEWDIIQNDVQIDDMVCLIYSTVKDDVSVLRFDFVVYDDSHNVDRLNHNHHQDHHHHHHHHYHHHDIVVSSFHHHPHQYHHDITVSYQLKHNHVMSHDENISVLVVEFVDGNADDVVDVIDRAYNRLIAVVATHTICELSSLSISITSSFLLSTVCTSYESSKLTSTTAPACVLIDSYGGYFHL
jgi:hypothetical protein